MAAFQKFNSFVEARGRGVHNLHADTLKVMLSNVAPIAANAVKGDITEIAAGNGYPAGGVQVANNTYVQSGGLAKLLGDDVVITASGGPIGPWRYAVLYNDTAVNDELIGFWDKGTSDSLADGEAVTIDLDQAAGILTDQ